MGLKSFLGSSYFSAEETRKLKQVIRNHFQILSKKAEIFKILRILVFLRNNAIKIDTQSIVEG
jgi:hypothetical protein